MHPARQASQDNDENPLLSSRRSTSPSPRPSYHRSLSLSLPRPSYLSRRSLTRVSEDDDDESVSQKPHVKSQ